MAGYSELSFFRFWLKVTVNGVSYELDPALKSYERIDGLSDILSSLNYSRSFAFDLSGRYDWHRICSKPPSPLTLILFLENLTTTLIAWLDGNHSDLTVS